MAPQCTKKHAKLKSLPSIMSGSDKFPPITWESFVKYFLYRLKEFSFLSSKIIGLTLQHAFVYQN